MRIVGVTESISDLLEPQNPTLSPIQRLRSSFTFRTAGRRSRRRETGRHDYLGTLPLVTRHQRHWA